MEKPWISNSYFVSLYNYLSEVMESYRFSDHIQLHDVTLRDGEQQIGIGFTKEEKVIIAEKLSEAGIHRIEAGLPAVSKVNEEAIKEMVRKNLASEIFAFSRCKQEDVNLARDCGAKGIVVEIPTSDHMLEDCFEWTREKVQDLIVETTRYAFEQGLKVSLFNMDSSRADLDWLVKLVATVIKDGHIDSYSLVDTQGVLSPGATRYLVRVLKKKLNLPLEVHLHNDLGLGIGNALAALEEGADIVHSTVLGIGPRAGQTATEQICMALKVLYGVDIGIKLDKLYELGRLVADITSHNVPVNQPVVGESIYQIESGIAASWWLRIKDDHPTSLYGILPSLVGNHDVEIILGKGSGTASIKHWLEKTALEVPEEKLPDIVSEVKSLAIEKKKLTEEDFRKIVEKVCL